MSSVSFLALLAVGFVFVIALTAYEIARTRRQARERFGRRVGRVTRHTGFFLALAFVSCLSVGLSQTIGRKAPVSAFFCVQTTATPTPFSGAGVVGGNKRPARAGNTTTGPIARENPGVGFDAITQTIDPMSSSPIRAVTLRHVCNTAPKKQRVTVRLTHEEIATLVSLAVHDAPFMMESNARSLPEILRWLALQAIKTGDINPIVAHVERITAQPFNGRKAA